MGNKWLIFTPYGVIHKHITHMLYFTPVIIILKSTFTNRTVLQKLPRPSALKSHSWALKWASPMRTDCVSVFQHTLNTVKTETIVDRRTLSYLHLQVLPTMQLSDGKHFPFLIIQCWYISSGLNYDHEPYVY